MPSLHNTVPVAQVAVSVAVSAPQRVVLLGTTVGAAGVLPVPIVIGSDATEVPQLLTQVAKYVPAPTEIGLPVAPLLQVRIPPEGHAPVSAAFSSPQTISLLVWMFGLPGAGCVVITTGVEAGELPHAFTQVAVYVPAPTVLGLAVVPSLHCTVPVAQVAVSVAVSAPQRVVLLGTTVGAAGVLPVPMVIGSDATEVPQLLTQVAVYVPAPTEIGLPVAPLLQVRIPPEGHAPVRVAFSAPQTINLLVWMFGLPGAGCVVITTGVEAGELPHAFTQVAVYVPAPTVLGLAVVPSLHSTVPVVQVAVSVAVSAPQRVVLLGTTVGAVGVLPVPIVIGSEATEVPQLLTQVAKYVPAPTEIGLPVEPLLQVRVPPEGHEPVRTAFSSPQTVCLLAWMFGLPGPGCVLITIVSEFTEVPHSLTQFA